MLPINGTLLNKISGKIIVLALLFFSCGEEKEEQENVPNENHASFQEKPVSKINNDPSTAEVEKKPQKKETEEKKNIFQIEKSQWGKKNGRGTYFHSARVDSLIKVKNKNIGKNPSITEDGYDLGYFTYEGLSKKDLEKLTAKEIIYYALAYPSDYAQTCAPFMWNEYKEGPSLYAYLPVSEEALFPSKIQKNHIVQRKDSVSILLEDYYSHQDSIDLAELELIFNNNLYSLLPTMCKMANDKNPLLYTFLLKEMEGNWYKPMMGSRWYNNMKKRVDDMGLIKLSAQDIEQIKNYALAYQASKTTIP